MKNKFIKITLSKKNEFRTVMDISIPSIGIDRIENVDVKIDTGCANTSIPVKKLGINDVDAQVYKQRDIDNNNIIKSISFGVNDTADYKKKVRELFAEGNIKEINSVTFRHTDVKMQLAGVNINVESIRVSYDRIGNILIGMDILKDWDIHIGTIDTGETIFLACPKDQLNDEYYIELNSLFDIENSIVTAETHKSI